MVLVNIVSHIDDGITIGVVGSEEIFSDIFDVSTSPDTWARGTVIRGGTIKLWVVFTTVDSSPFIFNSNFTVVDFTGGKSSVHVSITFSE